MYFFRGLNKILLLIPAIVLVMPICFAQSTNAPANEYLKSVTPPFAGTQRADQTGTALPTTAALPSNGDWCYWNPAGTLLYIVWNESGTIKSSEAIWGYPIAQPVHNHTYAYYNATSGIIAWDSVTTALSSLYSISPIYFAGGDSIGIRLVAGSGVSIAAGATADTIEANASGITLAGDVTHAANANQLSKISGYPLGLSLPPTNGNILIWNSGTSVWENHTLSQDAVNNGVGAVTVQGWETRPLDATSFRTPPANAIPLWDTGGGVNEWFARQITGGISINDTGYATVNAGSITLGGDVTGPSNNNLAHQFHGDTNSIVGNVTLSNFSATCWDRHDRTTSSDTVFLPLIAAWGKFFTFEKGDTAHSATVIKAASGDSLGGGSSPITLTAQFDHLALISGDPNNWMILSETVGGSSVIGAASGDLTGAYPNPTVARIQGVAVNAGTPAAGQFLIYDTTSATKGWTKRTLAGDVSVGDTGNAVVKGIQKNPVTSAAPADGNILIYDGAIPQIRWEALSGDATMSDSGALTLAGTGVTAGTYGDSADIPVITVDAKGRITGATTVKNQQYGNGIFGDGSDGAVALDGVNTYSFLTKAGTQYTMTRDIFVSSLTINTGVFLNTANFRIFCSGTVTDSNFIMNAGINAAGSVGGANAATGTLLRGSSGANGTSANANGSAGANANPGMGGAGGGGGNCTNTGGAGGAATAPAGALGAPHSVLTSLGYLHGGGSTSVIDLAPGAGGGAGASAGAGTSGGGGAGGGIVWIAAKIFKFAGTGQILATGGNGGNASGTNAGGGGGGGGGWVELITDICSPAASAGTNVQLSGGGAGTKTGTGVNGSAGITGTLIWIQN